jgi:hypothetical protein
MTLLLICIPVALAAGFLSGIAFTLSRMDRVRYAQNSRRRPF